MDDFPSQICLLDVQNKLESIFSSPEPKAHR